MKRNNNWTDKIDLTFLCLFIATLFCLLIATFNKGNGIDEREHLYSTIQILNGKIPYRDFFQHHHPLLWYSFAPIAYFFQESANIIYASRIFILGFNILTCVFVYKISRLCLLPRWISICSVVLYVTNDIVLSKGIDFRPDNPMITMFIGGVYYLLKYITHQKQSTLSISFLFFILSFLFLQKAVFLLLPIGLVCLWFLIKKQISLKHFYVACICPMLFSCLFVIVLLLNNSWKDYFELNWLLNMEMGKYEPFSANLYERSIFLIFGFLCALIAFKEKKNNIVIKIASFVFLCFGIELLFIPTPWEQYWLPVYSLLGIIVVYVLFQKSNKNVFKIFILFISVPAIMHTFYMRSDVNSLKQNVKIADYILKHTHKSDYVLDEHSFNIHRKNVTGYYWFARFNVALLDMRVYKRHLPPKLNDLLKTYKPIVITIEPWVDWYRKIEYTEKSKFAEIILNADSHEYVSYEMDKQWFGRKEEKLKIYPIVEKLDMEYVSEHYTKITSNVYIRNDRYELFE